MKEVRAGAGYSQRELAARAGVPHGLISVLEQNKSSPSVSSLRKITMAIPMTLAEFFKEDTAPPQKIFFRKTELVNLVLHMPSNRRNRSSLIELFQIGDARTSNLQLLFERYQPGADTGSTMFQHEAYEGGIVIRGTLELTVGTEVGVLKAGDAYLFDSRLPHRYRNIGPDVLELVAACTPPFL